MSRTAMPPPVLSISTARQKLFDLFELVTRHRGRKVIVTSRGVESRAVLVAEQYLDHLETAARKLQEIESSKGNPADFRLIGSGRIPETLDDPLADIRAEANAASDEKLVSLRK